MYLRTIKRKNKDGSVVEYVQLANNVWNKEKGFAQAQVIHSFGRSDQLDIDALRRLIKSASRFLDPQDAIRLERQSSDLKFVSSRPAGGAHLLKGLWQRLNIDDCMKKALDQRSFTAPVAEALFAMVANRRLRRHQSWPSNSGRPKRYTLATIQRCRSSIFTVPWTFCSSTAKPSKKKSSGPRPTC